MKNIDLGKFLTVLANVGVLLGILLLVYELNQARDFARVEFLANNRFVFQEIERDMMNPEVAAVWAKAAVQPDSLTITEIRVMDAFLISHYNYLHQQWILVQEGFLDPVAFDRQLRTNTSFYFGNIFARVWWEDLKSMQSPPESSSLHAFNDLIDEALSGSDSSANRKFVERLQRLVNERASVEKE